MGQKIIPTSLRLYKNKNWNSSFINQTFLYSKYFFIEYEIRFFLIRLFNQKKINIHDIIIKNTNNSFLVFVFLVKKIQKSKYFYFNYLIKNTLENFLSIFYKKNIKLNFIHLNFYYIKQKKNIFWIYFLLRKKKILKFFNKKILYLLNLAILTKNASFLTIIFLKLLKKKKFHKKILEQTTKELSNLYFLYPNFTGYRIQFKGKLNSKNRSKKWKMQKGKMPLNSLTKQIEYSMKHISTPSGICSIKVWLFFDIS